MRPLVPRELTPYQLNFQYQEQGKLKQALVKVVLCPKCKSKLTWKKDQEKLARREQEGCTTTVDGHRADKGKGRAREEETESSQPESYRREKPTHRDRSKSPRRDRDHHSNHRQSRERNERSRDSPRTKAPAAKARIRTVITSLMGKYYDAILDGSKTWEGRTNTPRYASLRPDDEFIFHHAEDASQPAFTVRILEVEKFDTFRDMLKGRVQDFLPGVDNVDEAVRVYEGIPGYKEQVKEHGAAAFRVKVTKIESK